MKYILTLLITAPVAALVNAWISVRRWGIDPHGAERLDVGYALEAEWSRERDALVFEVLEKHFPEVARHWPGTGMEGR